MGEPTRHEVTSVDNLDAGERIIVEIDGVEIAVFCIDGEYYAVANYCVHQSGPLCTGELTGHVTIADDGWDWKYADTEQMISCPWHGWKFDVTTGNNLQDDRYKVPTYETEVIDGDVYVVR